MESQHARSRLRFRLFALIFFAVLGGAAWHFISGGRPAEPGGITSDDISLPPPPPVDPAAVPSDGPAPSAGLAIEGSAFFKRQVTRSLRLIWNYDKDAFNFIRKYVYVVRSADKTAFGMHAGPTPTSPTPGAPAS